MTARATRVAQIVGELAISAAILLAMPQVCVGEPAQTGPRITDSELLGALDLEYPGLGPVAEALRRGRTGQAKAALAAYYRSREKPVPVPRRSRRIDPDRVRRWVAGTMERRFRVVGITHDFGAGNDIDWFHNATGGDTGLAFNPEWTWQLNRHSPWYSLAMAYATLKDEAYAREFAFQVSDWARDCARPLSGNVNAAGSAWRTIESGIRMAGSWPMAFFAFRRSPSVDDDTLLDMVKLFVEHAYHLMPESRFRSTSNWGTMESNGLFSVGVLFPEFQEAASWRKTAMNRLYGELDKQVYPDGMQIELASGYHQVSLRNMVQPLRLARLNGIAFPDDYLAKLEKMYHFDLYAARPDGRLPAVNDGGRTDVRRYLREGAEFFPERKDFLWMATRGEEGTRPQQTSTAFPYTGYLAMRSGWDLDDLYLMFDVGPYGRGHQHEDKLSLVTYAYGRQHIIDPGNYTYERSKWRSFIKTTFAHNTVVVDGMGQHRRGVRSTYVVQEPLPHTWTSEEAFDYAEGVYEDGYGSENVHPAVHRRRVLFVKPAQDNPGYWVVSDLLTPSDDATHRYEALFHLDVSPDSVSVDPRSLRVETHRPTGSNFLIWPCSEPKMVGAVLAGQEEPVLRGWQRGRGRGAERPVPLPVASYTIEAAGVVRTLYVLYPLREGEARPIASVTAVPATGNAIVGRISFADGRIHEIVQQDLPGGTVRCGAVDTDARAAVVERAADGRVRTRIQVEGTFVTPRGTSGE